MPKILIIGTDQYEFPVEGENSGYGEEITDWASAVSKALTSVQQPNDILVTTSTILNNNPAPASPIAIAGFSFDTAEVVSINTEFIITRSTVSPAVTIVESGFLQGNYDGTNWSISIEATGAESGVSLDITSGGQVTYNSTNMVGTSYAGKITFRGRVFNQA